MHLVRKAREPSQGQITDVVHRYPQGRQPVTNEMAQSGQMSQACNTACPNCLNTIAVLYLDKPLQVLHQGVGESVQGESQLMTWFS